MRRAHCRCEAVRNYSYAQAAEKLGCKVRFLRDRISRLPHQRMGESVAFCDCELDLIRAMHTVVPASVEALVNPPAPSAAPTAVPSLHSIRPSKGRKTARVS
ncbi:hypothetical protein ACFWR6_07225 [Streptomyces griseus]|uniref:hypothetical protein n=1 Tax=Streptomyces griseus TaxID=1911 RepID=UPI003657DA86